ncbi:UNVERIFIED_CONTAM: hypothetical protein FKN15_004883 [Acipenser sinensis]
MACQLNSSFGGDCDQRKNASVSHNGKTNCTSLQPFSRYALVFTVNAYNSKSQLFTKKVALPEQTFYVNTTQTEPVLPDLTGLTVFNISSGIPLEEFHSTALIANRATVAVIPAGSL